MRILVTGGLGYLGSWVTKRLVERGHSVTTLSRADRPVLSDLNFDRRFGDVRRIQDLRPLISDDHAWDAVIHLATASDTVDGATAEESLLVNTLGTRNLLDVLYSTKSGSRPHLIYFSTFHVYGRTSGRVAENMAPAPRSDYASTHLFAEYYIKQFHSIFGIPFTIFRLTNGYGAPLEKTSTKWHLAVNDLCRLAVHTGEITLRGDGLSQRDFIWLGDVCEVVEKALSLGPSNRTFNLGSGQSITTVEVARIVQETYRETHGEDIPIHVNTAVTADEKNEDLVVAIDSLRDWTGFTPSDRIQEEVRKIFTLLRS